MKKTNNSSNLEKCNNLLTEIIAHAKALDASQKEKMIRKGKLELAVGKSWLVFHLEQLQELINKND